MRQRESFREKHSMSSCVLCSNSIVQNCDKNLVDGRKGNTFNVRSEILTLDYEVLINSPYICRSCLALLKRRRALLTSLGEVNSKLHKVVNRSSNNFILPVSKSPTPQSNLFEGDFRQEQPAKRIALEDLRSGDQRHKSHDRACQIESQSSNFQFLQLLRLLARTKANLLPFHQYLFHR